MQSPTYPRASECIDQDEDPLSPHHAFVARRVLFKQLGGSQAERLREGLPEAARDWLFDEGFQELGAYQEALNWSWTLQFDRLAHVAPQGFVRLDVGINKGRDFGPRRGFVYLFSTYFEDGAAILTWSHPAPHTQSNARLESWGSLGGLAEDYSAHLSRVETHLLRGAIPLRFESLEDARATHSHYYRRVANEADVRQLRGVLLFNLAMLIITPLSILAVGLFVYFNAMAG